MSNLYLSLGFICLFCVLQIDAGKRCKASQKTVTLKDMDVFDIHDRGQNDISQLKKVAKGVKGKLKLMAMDVLAVDGDNQQFNLKKLCIAVKGATHLTFQYMTGPNLDVQVGDDEDKEIANSDKFSKVCSRNVPKGKIGGFIILITDDDNVFNNPNAKSVIAKNLDIKACVDMTP